jgi:adenylate cyclase
MQGDNARAVELIRRANMRRFPVYYFVAALIFVRQGLRTDAELCRAEFLRLRPEFFDAFDTELDRRNFTPRDRAILIRGAVEAGFPVPARFVTEAEQQSQPGGKTPARSQP